MTLACALSPASRMIEALVALSRQYGCYKVILDCSEENASFYEKCGLSRNGVQMVSWGAVEVALAVVCCAEQHRRITVLDTPPDASQDTMHWPSAASSSHERFR